MKSLAALLSVMLFAAPAVKVVGPAAVMGPLWVIAPVLVRARVPVLVVPALALSGGADRERAGGGEGQIAAREVHTDETCWRHWSG